jgi:transposase
MRKRRRFTPEFKSKVVLDVLTGAQSPAEACRKHALSPNLLTLWKATFLERAHTLFQPDEQRDEDQTRIAELEQLLGRSTRQIEILKKQRPDRWLEIPAFAPYLQAVSLKPANLTRAWRAVRCLTTGLRIPISLSGNSTSSTARVRPVDE